MAKISDDLETKVVAEEWESARANAGDATDPIDPAEITEIPPADPNHPLVRGPTLPLWMCLNTFLELVLD